MATPPQSPVRSPPSSPPPRSPPSSPHLPERSPLKLPRWEVFAFRGGGSSRPSRPTVDRWVEQGYLPQEAGPSKQGLHEDGDAFQYAGQDVEEAVMENVESMNCDDEGLRRDSDSDDAPPDSSDSELPHSDISDICDFSDGRDHFDVWNEDEDEWFDAEEEIFYQEMSHNQFDEDDLINLTPLYNNSALSKEEAILDLLNDFLTNKETQKGLKDHLATFIKYLPKGNTMPTSVYTIFKYLKSLAPSYAASVVYCCHKCLLYLENVGSCPACKETSRREFYMFDLEEQIKFYFEHRRLASIIDKYKVELQLKSNNGNVITDVCDGEEYKRFKVNDEYSITLILNTDGVSLSKSSVWCEPVAPPMNTLLRPLCESLVKIDECGGVIWTHPDTGASHTSLVSVPLVCADAPVRAQIQNIMSHNAKYACNTCEQKSDQIPLTNAEQTEKRLGNKNIRCRRGFLFKIEGARLRSGERMLKQAKKAFITGKSVKGVVGPSVLSKVPRLDLGTCVMAEYMHGVCLGVVKHFLNLWLLVPGGLWYVGKKVDEIDAMIVQIKPPSNIGRLPRAVSELCKWKASELRAWLIFYSLIIMSCFLPTNYIQHWMLLVTAIHLLLKDEISEDDLQNAEIMINMFVKNVGRLYRKRDYLYNVHQLVHLPLYVRRWGPLWATSAFQFENFNGILAGIVHGTKNRAKELVNLVHVSHGVEILRARIHTAYAEQSKEINYLELSSELKCDKLLADQTFISSKGFSVPFRAFARAIVHKEIFTSLSYPREKKRINYCVGFKIDNKMYYGEIKYFISENSEAYALVRCYDVEHTRLFINDTLRTKVRHIIPVRISDTLYLVNVNLIIKMVKVDTFVCQLPNMYEKNL